MQQNAQKAQAAQAPRPATQAPPKNKIISQAQIITPPLAAQWLEGHTHNRALSHAKAMGYAADMKTGLWELNGEAIIFDWNGVLQDGQHRLWACVEADTSFHSMVTTGIDPATFSTIDTGKSRSASDVLSIEKFPDKTTLAAAAKMVFMYWHGNPRHNQSAKNREILEFVKANTGLVEWVTKAKQAPRVAAVTSHLAAVMYVAAKRYPHEAETFLHLFKTGENLTVGSPILTIRNRIFTDRGLTSAERLELIVRAWNAYIENRMIVKAVIVPQSPFPRIKGDPQEV